MEAEMKMHVKIGEGIVGQYIDMIELPNGEAVFHNPATHTISFEPLVEFIGHPFTLIKNGTPTALCQLENVTRDVNDNDMFNFSVIEDYKGEFLSA